MGGLFWSVNQYAAEQKILEIMPIESKSTQEATSKLDQRFKHAQPGKKDRKSVV